MNNNEGIPRIHPPEELKSNRNEFFGELFGRAIELYNLEEEDELNRSTRYSLKQVFESVREIIDKEWEDKVIDHETRKEKCLEEVDRIFRSEDSHYTDEFIEKIKTYVEKAYDEYLLKNAPDYLNIYGFK